jgi:cell wall-associated NlpC family hydrolase
VNSDRLDPRRHAYREDMAASGLSDKVQAPRYVDGVTQQVIAARAPLRSAPKFHAPLMTEALHGEAVTVYDSKDGWIWGQLKRDGYVGYIPADHLSSNVFKPTHAVRVRATYIFPSPDIKTPPIDMLTFGARTAADGREGRFLSLARGGYIFAEHCVGAGDKLKDYVRAAERLVGTPYLWGGKTSLGLDCSALVQLSLHAAGIDCPRDTDMQESEVGEAVEGIIDDGALKGGLERGDLIFWKGHVAIAQSSDWIVHASGQQMETVMEPVRHAIERIGQSWGKPTSVKRPSNETTILQLPDASADQ